MTSGRSCHFLVILPSFSFQWLPQSQTILWLMSPQWLFKERRNVQRRLDCVLICVFEIVSHHVAMAAVNSVCSPGWSWTHSFPFKAKIAGVLLGTVPSYVFKQTEIGKMEALCGHWATPGYLPPTEWRHFSLPGDSLASCCCLKTVFVWRQWLETCSWTVAEAPGSGKVQGSADNEKQGLLLKQRKEIKDPLGCFYSPLASGWELSCPQTWGLETNAKHP